MKFSINASELQNALTTVSKGSDSNPAQPILAGILLNARESMLTLESTNLNLSIRCALPALVEEEGRCVIPSKLLVDVVKSLPDAAVHIQAEDDEDKATILCEASTFSLKTFAAQDFPGFPEVAADHTMRIPYGIFKRMVRRTAKVTSRDESRAILTGILVETAGGLLRMVATDSYRLAVTEAPFGDTAESFSAVIPGAFMQDLAALPEIGCDIEMAVAENQIIAEYGSTTFISRRIEGNYPPYNQLLPDSFKTRATFDTKQLIDAVKRTSLLSNKTSAMKLDLNASSQTTQISTATQDIGAASETIRSKIEGDDCEIAFNFGYTIDGLSSSEEDEVSLELQGAQRPGIFKSGDSERYLYLIMPIRMQ